WQLFTERFHLPITVMAGPVTDSGVGRDFIAAQLGIPAHNARHDAEGLVEVVHRCIVEKRGAA
ncbi:MAG: hypothetical protein KJ042_17015, partial [Deltaproteobacteria bacterium]|nr:hypothetical protein [Deltaproteobacteria bacterium]